MRTDATDDYYLVAHMRPEVGHQGKPCDLLGVTRPLAITRQMAKAKVHASRGIEYHAYHFGQLS